MPRRERRLRLEKGDAEREAKRCRTITSFFSSPASTFRRETSDLPAPHAVCDSAPETENIASEVEVTPPASVVACPPVHTDNDDNDIETENKASEEEVTPPASVDDCPPVHTDNDDNDMGHVTLTPNIYDVGNIVQGRVCLEKLEPSEKIKYLENHFQPPPDYKHFHTQVIQKGNQSKKTLKFQTSWLDTYNWLVYSPSDSGGYCKYCVLFPSNNTRLANAVLVSRPFQNLQKAKGQYGVLDPHEQREYHKEAVAKGKLFVENFRKPEKHVDALLNKRAKEIYDRNVHVVKSIIEAVALCGKQNLALRGHRDDNTSEASNMGNFRAILELLAMCDPELKTHLENGKKNCRYTSKTVQNEIIDLIGVYIRNQITKDLREANHSKYFSVIADEVTDTTTNKEVLSLCLR